MLKNILLKYKLFLDNLFPHSTNIYFITFASCFTGILYGNSIVSMSPIVKSHEYDLYFNHPSLTLSGFITGSISLGAIFGSFFSPYFTNYLGRKFSFYICNFFWILGSALQGATINIPMLIFGRIIAGIGIGFGVVTAPMYLTEISPPKLRGTVVGIFQFFTTIGILILFFIAYGTSHIHNPGLFRIPWIIQILPGILDFFLKLFLPESPRWLASHRKWNDATEIIFKISKNQSNAQIKYQLDELKAYILTDRYGSHFSYLNIFKNKITLHKTILGFLIQSCQALSGINVIMFYVTYLVQMAGYSSNSLLLTSSIEYILNVAVTLAVLLFFIDRIDRRIILLTGSILMTIFMMLETILLGVFTVPATNGGYHGNEDVTILIPKKHSPAAKATIAFSYLFVSSFAATWGITIWIYYNEIFNNTERAHCTSFSICGNWLFNFVVALFTPAAFKKITWKTNLIFAIFNFLLIIITYFYFPETNGRTLEEIDMLWHSNIPAWKSKNWNLDKNNLNSVIIIDESDERSPFESENTSNQINNDDITSNSSTTKKTIPQKIYEASSILDNSEYQQNSSSLDFNTNINNLPMPMINPIYSNSPAINNNNIIISSSNNKHLSNTFDSPSLHDSNNSIYSNSKFIQLYHNNNNNNIIIQNFKNLDNQYYMNNNNTDIYTPYYTNTNDSSTNIDIEKKISNSQSIDLPPSPPPIAHKKNINNTTNDTININRKNSISSISSDFDTQNNNNHKSSNDHDKDLIFGNLNMQNFHTPY